MTEHERALLSGERTALNILGRLCGIATAIVVGNAAKLYFNNVFVAVDRFMEAFLGEIEAWEAISARNA